MARFLVVFCMLDFHSIDVRESCVDTMMSTKVQWIDATSPHSSPPRHLIMQSVVPPQPFPRGCSEKPWLTCSSDHARIETTEGSGANTGEGRGPQCDRTPRGSQVAQASLTAHIPHCSCKRRTRPGGPDRTSLTNQEPRTHVGPVAIMANGSPPTRAAAAPSSECFYDSVSVCLSALSLGPY